MHVHRTQDSHRVATKCIRQSKKERKKYFLGSVGPPPCGQQLLLTSNPSPECHGKGPEFRGTREPSFPEPGWVAPLLGTSWSCLATRTRGRGCFAEQLLPTHRRPAQTPSEDCKCPHGAAHQKRVRARRPSASPHPEPHLFDLARPTRRSAFPSRESCWHRPLRAEPRLSPPRVLSQPQSAGRTGCGPLRGERERGVHRWEYPRPLNLEKDSIFLQPERMFGVVVVGVGRAGSVRIRDLQTPPPPADPLKLIGFVSRRELGNINEAKQISLQDALSNIEVDVAYICNENVSHEEHIRQFLRAGKHVLVEYPMALSLASAQELWKIAEEKEWLKNISHTFSKDLMNSNINSNSLISFSLRRPLTWIEERGPDLKRERHVNFLFESGRLESLPPPAQGNKNLFLRDQHIFVKKLLGQMSTEDIAKEKKRILHCLEIADKIQKYC
ncbi:biliverdin reductase A [Gracilinanus agilis]|uniref:biliverdin reductase A n=1 Tax=Gracilinanus agilis TaxID=191870 RepID=UPI001CFD2B1D|nr:biliverdin reductase A [Gracilinanus agilis]